MHTVVVSRPETIDPENEYCAQTQNHADQKAIKDGHDTAMPTVQGQSHHADQPLHWHSWSVCQAAQ